VNAKVATFSHLQSMRRRLGVLWNSCDSRWELASGHGKRVNNPVRVTVMRLNRLVLDVTVTYRTCGSTALLDTDGELGIERRLPGNERRHPGVMDRDGLKQPWPSGSGIASWLLGRFIKSN